MWHETNGRAVKKLVWRWPTTEELLRNDCREEKGLHMTDAGHRELMLNRVAFRMADYRWGERLGNDFLGKKMF